MGLPGARRGSRRQHGPPLAASSLGAEEELVRQAAAVITAVLDGAAAGRLDQALDAVPLGT